MQGQQNLTLFLGAIHRVSLRISTPPEILQGLPANMSRNFFNILEGFQKVEESLDGPEGQYVEEIDMPI